MCVCVSEKEVSNEINGDFSSFFAFTSVGVDEREHFRVLETLSNHASCDLRS